MRNPGKIVSALLVGAGLAFLLDPDRGARRRALARDKAIRAGRKLKEGVGATARDLRNRAGGTAAELRSRLRQEEVDDDVLHERVRAAIGRAVSNPSAIGVSVDKGRVTLSGPVLLEEVGDLLATAESVRGVREVINQLDARRAPEGEPALQGREDPKA
ncbi:MAG TPA: BON domain-containing protein [Gemmatimonadales bacterium]|nr:BON domain-containing protein [Gemmatimonadales bacterium]